MRSGVPLGGVSDLLANVLLERGHAEGLDLLGISEKCAKRTMTGPRSDFRRVRQLSHLIESNEMHIARCSISMDPTSDQCLIVATSTSTDRAAASIVTDAYSPRVRSDPDLMRQT